MYKGLIIVGPHGTYIRTRVKTLIVKSRKLNSIINQKLLLIENKLGLGIIILGHPKKITLSQFDKLRKFHRITEKERIDWWPSYQFLYAYPIINKKFFKIPLLLDYPTGPQITVSSDNIIVKKVLVGMSGYHYKYMYPKVKNLLEYYSQHFNTVEINNTFYRLPTESLVNNLTKYDLWYSIKVSQFITHSKKLKDVKKYWNQFYKPLKDMNRLICFLFQFSSRFYFNDENFNRIKKLPSFLDPKHYYAFEFRDKSWFNNDRIDKLFKENKWIQAISNVNNSDMWIGNLDDGFNPRLNKYVLTSDALYIRMHGPKGKYIGSYKSEIFKDIFEFVRSKPIKYAFIYFNNTDNNRDAFEDSLKLNAKFNYLNTKMELKT